MTRDSRIIAIVLTIGLTLTGALQASDNGKPLVERWNLSGSTIADLRANAAYPRFPTSRWYTETVDISTIGDNYYLRVRGLVTPTVSGDYTLYLSADDQGELWLSSDENAANITKTAYLNTWVASGKFTEQASQKSAVLHLEAGKKYYFEAFQREGNGGDHLQVAWSLDGGTPETIPAVNLSMFNDGDTTPPSVPEVTALRLSRQVIRLNWDASTDASGVYGYRVYRNGALLQEQAETVVAIPAADGADYTVAAVDIFGNISAVSMAVTTKGSFSGNGLLARYYKGKTFGELVACQIDPTVNFNWGTGKGNETTGTDNFAVRWEGTISPRYTEEYTFTTSSDDGARLWIDGIPVIDKWVEQSSRSWSGKIALISGQAHRIRLEYFENSGEATCRLTWKSSTQAEEIIPQECLTPELFTEDCENMSLTWTGHGLDNLWSNPANWNTGVVPSAAQQVVFSSIYPKDCFIDTDITVNGLTTSGSYRNTVYAVKRALTITGDYNLGTAANGFDAETTLTISGKGAQSVMFPVNQKFQRLTVDNTSGRVCFNSDINVGTFTISQGTTVAFAPNKTVYADAIDWQGTAEKPVRLGQSAIGEPWILRLTPGGTQQVRHVEVAGSNAKYSPSIDATAGGRDYGGNTNWIFDTAAAVEITQTEVDGTVIIDGATNGTEANAIKVYVNGVLVPVTNSGLYRYNATAELAAGDNIVQVMNGEEVVLEKNVAYAAGDITGSGIAVRAVDGLLLKGEGNLNAKANVMLDADGDGILETTAFRDGKFALALEPGLHEFTAGIDRNRDGAISGDNEQNQKLTVKAVAVNWNGDARGNIACQQGFIRGKNDVTITGAGLDEINFVAANPVACILMQTGGAMVTDMDGKSAATPALTVLPLTLENQVLQARYGGENGVIIAECPLDVFTFKTTVGSKIDILETYADGSAKNVARLVLTPHIADLTAKLHIFVWGATFEDATIDHIVSTNDFIRGVPYADWQSSYPYSIIMTRARQQVHGPCHTYKIYQNGVLVGE